MRRWRQSRSDYTEPERNVGTKDPTDVMAEEAHRRRLDCAIIKSEKKREVKAFF
ncbi:unnamed protein product [Brassica oleracea]